MKKSIIKKAICLVLPAALLVCASCKKSAELKTTVTQAVTETPTTEQFSDKIKANGFMPSLLPEGFPDELPSGLTCKTQSHYFADEKTYGYKTDFIRLRLAGDSSVLSQFSESLNAFGWTGGIAFHSEEETGDKASVEGYWSNGKYICSISQTDFNIETSEYTVSFDVFQCVCKFDENVAKFFPALDAPLLGEGKLEIIGADGEKVTDPALMEECDWQCIYSSGNAFAGVKFETLDAYFTALTEAGFTLTQTDGTNENGSFCVMDAQKTVGDRTYYAQFVYAQYLQAVTAMFTNNPSFFFE